MVGLPLILRGELGQLAPGDRQSGACGHLADLTRQPLPFGDASEDNERVFWSGIYILCAENG